MQKFQLLVNTFIHLIHITIKMYDEFYGVCSYRNIRRVFC